MTLKSCQLLIDVFYQLFELILMAPIPCRGSTVSKWYTFLKICSSEETNSSTSQMTWVWVNFHQILIYGWTISVSSIHFLKCIRYDLSNPSFIWLLTSICLFFSSGKIDPGQAVTVKFSFKPTRAGLRKLLVDFDSDRLRDVKGEATVIVRTKMQNRNAVPEI